MQRKLASELSARSESDLLMLCAFYRISPIPSTKHEVIKAIVGAITSLAMKSGTMKLDCDANQNWELTGLQKADEDTCFTLQTKHGFCWDPKSLAQHILANGNKYTNAQYEFF